MGVNHRVLYVGIGGTGVHIGKELEIALRRDLCGPDGKTLINKGGAFGKLEPYQLPDYVQSLYFDFDDDAEQILQQGTDLNTNLIRENATVVKSIHSTGATSYRVAAEMLRADKETSKITKSWLPEKDNEPQVAPLSDGAGQYPTVGRAALYLALKRSGNDIEREIDHAIEKLVRAGGMLHAMKNESDKPKVLCYVGFSVAGGTGTGIFYDIIHLLEKRLSSILQGIEVNIFPLTLLPSAFTDSWKPNNITAGKANAAIALKDLAHLVEHLQKDDQPDNFKMHYPQPFGETKMTPASIPTAFLFSKAASVNQQDMYKSMASFIMSQITTGEVLSDNTGTKNLHSKETQMSVFSKIINDKNLTGEMDKYGPGLKPFSPAISSSLSIPVESVADLISKKLIAEFIKENNENSLIQAQNNSTDMAEVLKNMELNFMIDPVPTKPQNLVDEEENMVASSGKDLIKNTSYYRNQLQRWINSFEPFARKSITEASMDWNQEVIRLLSSNSLLKTIRIFQGANLAQDTHSKEGVIGKLTNFSSTINKSSVTPELPRIKGPKTFMKGSNPRVKTEYLRQSLPAWYKNEFKIKWQDAWNVQRSKWQTTVDEINDTFSIVNSGLEIFILNTEQTWEINKTGITQDGVLVSGFLPLDSGNLDTLKDALVKSLLNTPSQQTTPTASDLFKTILPNDIWQDAWKEFIKKSVDNVNEATHELLHYVKVALKNKIVEELQKTSADGSSLLPNLKNLLIRASRSGITTTSNQIKRLQSELGNMIPLDAVPDAGQGVPTSEIWINYPLNEKDEQVEEYLKKHITAGWPTQHEMIGKINCYPVGGESIFISMYNYGNGLFSLREPRQLFKELFNLKNTPEGRELQWRQRLSTETVYNLASKRDYVNALQYFLVAAWNDRIVINEGSSIKDAKSVSIILPNGNSIQLELKKFGQFSTISDLPEAFKDFWVSMDSNDSSNWDQLLSMMPYGAEHGDIFDNLPKTKIFADIVDMVESKEVTELENIIKNSELSVDTAPGVTAKAKLKLEFWKELLPEALNKTIGAGTYNKLNQLVEEMKKEKGASG